jgi:glycerol uptake facilitator protein
MFGKKQVAMFVAEFLGSGLLTLVVIGVQHSTIGVPYFVGVAAALAAAMLVLVFGAASGAVLNPALTIALWSVRRLKTVAALGYLVAQLLGAWAAYYVFTYHINQTLSTTGGDFSARVLVAEAVGAGVLAFGWAAASYGKFLPGLKATTVGLGYAIGIVIASSASIGLINPGVALADRAWTIWGSMGWGTYVLGPVLGALIGFNLFAWLFTNEMSLKALKVGGTTARTSTAAPAAKKAPAKKKTAARKRK